MGIDRSDVGELCAGHPKETVLYPDNLLSHNIIFVFLKQVVYFADNACCGVLDGKHRKISAALVYGAHGVPEGIHMEAVDLIPKILRHCRLGIGAVRSLEDHSRLPRLQFLHLYKRQPAKASRLCQKPVLQLPAHGHDLFKKLLDALSVKLVVGQRPDLLKLLRLALSVKNLFSGTDLVFRHLSADIHPFLVQFHDLRVYGIDLRSQFQ